MKIMKTIYQLNIVLPNSEEATYVYFVEEEF